LLQFIKTIAIVGERSMTSTRKLWIILFAVLFGSFAVLLLIGRDIAIKAPPMPERVVRRVIGESVSGLQDLLDCVVRLITSLLMLMRPLGSGSTFLSRSLRPCAA
jgi:hypothetical protein